MTRIIFSADLHGNPVQYKKLAEYSNANNAHSVIIGGDIAPKGFPHNEYIDRQANFFKHQFPLLMQAFQSQVFLMMGNDDAKANEYLVDLGDGDLYDIIHNTRIPLGEGFDIVGYSYVPITPFNLKDWEKWDIVDIPDYLNARFKQVVKENYRLFGERSITGDWKEFEFDESQFPDSIQQDLEKKIFTDNPKKLVVVTHSPPQGVHDMCRNGRMVGSLAVSEYILHNQPHMTLHGHIHETVQMTGIYKTFFGKTVCMTSGNTHDSKDLALLDIDLEHPEKSIRRIV